MNDDKGLTAVIGAALLDSMGKALNNWSMLLALAAIVILGLKQSSGYSHVFFADSLIMALLQGYFAARCAFDAAVFTTLGGEARHYQGFDQILTRWKLRRASTITRSLNERVQGARRLLRWQAVCFFIQIGLLVVGLIVA
jgi:hypothetical protein